MGRPSPTGMVAGVASAAALIAAAFFAVDTAACADPARYVRHVEHVALVGGCIDAGDLPPAKPTRAPSGDAQGVWP